MSNVIIKDLNYTNEQISEVRRIQIKFPVTRRRDAIRAILGGGMCAICSDIPSKRVEYDLNGLTRVEGYCDKHFQEVYEKTKNTSIDQIAEEYGCVKGEPN